MTPKILVIDDDTSFCIMLKTFLQKKGFEVTNAFNAMEAGDLIRSTTFDVVLTDIRLPDSDGLHILELVKSVSQKTQVILMTGYTDIKAAVNAMKLGAFDYVGKPINPDEILHTIQQSLKKSAKTDVAVTESKAQKTVATASVSFVKGISSHANKLHEYITLVAPTNMSVLIMGDSGTGKEYIAHSIHSQSKRADKPFIAVDCGAIPKDLASSEFFGHIKGSFTGAVNDKTGHFEAANGGTIFLDEVGNLSYEVQVQLLRALQERKVKPVGSNNEIKVDIRVIAATNEDLAEAVRQGDFREDLYHRLNEFSIQAPRLSERKHDIMIFAHHFLAEANDDLERNVTGFDEQVSQLFLNYDWPGNLREMKNTIKRSVLLTPSGLITTSVLPHEMMSENKDDSQALYKEDEETAIRNALDKTNFNKSKAARLLDIDRKTLYNKLKLYNIDL
ncbi:sigma-54-dependent Fis family transcriptional regulator [Flavobacterium sp. MAH-1]|uniref:Sigma-54-dependent Fis family transcriptional regulator n=1 Tax=Flavobacterium agri TaxID=2743471 RepID=A0A7Y9C5T6_9FLAO|nr:sigma-54 dependent transcriptional regulator [Flavobacterium agri]NUY80735.1 sigma-54-dependent Fis family transcriptional regulator [Flavobacterium agri]NYA70759.1 sigma-54-dependent Fis family transcriptional regulator [Flavobacterium agri]